MEHAQCAHKHCHPTTTTATACKRTADFDGRLQLQQDGLLHEHITCTHAQALDLVLSELNLWTRPQGANEDRKKTGSGGQ